MESTMKCCDCGKETAWMRQKGASSLVAVCVPCNKMWPNVRLPGEDVGMDASVKYALPIVLTGHEWRDLIGLMASAVANRYTQKLAANIRGQITHGWNGIVHGEKSQRNTPPCQTD